MSQLSPENPFHPARFTPSADVRTLRAAAEILAARATRADGSTDYAMTSAAATVTLLRAQIERAEFEVWLGTVSDRIADEMTAQILDAIAETSEPAGRHSTVQPVCPECLHLCAAHATVSSGPGCLEQVEDDGDERFCSCLRNYSTSGARLAGRHEARHAAQS